MQARGLLVVVAYALHRMAFLEEESPSAPDLTVLEDLVESFSSSQVKKRNLVAKFCTVLCDTVSDKATLLELGGLMLPLEHHSIIVTFAPTTDDTTRTALPQEICLALKNHKTHFFKGGLTLQVTSFIPAPPEFLFKAALFTLFSLEQSEKVPTPTERPRQGLDILAGTPPPTKPRTVASGTPPQTARRRPRRHTPSTLPHAHSNHGGQ